MEENNIILKNIKQSIQKNNFEEALSITKANKDQFDLGPYYYNVSYLNFRLGKLVEARLNIEKSKENGFYSKQLISLEKSIKENSYIEQIEDDNDISSTLIQNIYKLGTDLLLSLVLISMIIFLYSLVKKLKKTAYSFLFISLMGLSIIVIKDNYYKEFIVIEEGVVYEGPSSVFDPVSKLLPVSKIIAVEYNDNWYKIIFPTAYNGWIKNPKLKEIGK